MAEFFTRIKCDSCSATLEYWAEVTVETDAQETTEYQNFKVETALVVTPPPAWESRKPYGYSSVYNYCPVCVVQMNQTKKDSLNRKKGK